MDLFLLLFIYVMLVAASIFLLLFGEAPMFTNTPIAQLHWLLFYGVCEGAWYVIRLKQIKPHPEPRSSFSIVLRPSDARNAATGT